MATVIGEDQAAKERFTCKGTKTAPGCGAIVEYDRSDIKRYEGRDYSGGADGREWVVCPRCGKEHTLRSW